MVLQKGFKLSRDENGMYLKKSNVTYNFNKKIKSREGQLVRMKIIKHTDDIPLTSSTATKLGMGFMCADEICESCIKGKQQQKKTEKLSLRR